MVDSRYYTLWYRLDGRNRYLIWITNGKDRFYRNNNHIPAFDSASAAQEYAVKHGITLVQYEPLLHDLDAVKHWLKSPNADICCQDVLAAWNLFVDVSATFPAVTECFDSLDKKYAVIYDKVFHGNNLPAITPPGKKYEPSWHEQEVDDLAELLRAGFELFRRAVKG